MSKVVDLTGEVFGRLTVLVREREGGRTRYVCRCGCGSLTTVAHGNLRYGGIKSCGCLRREILDKTTHGHSSLSEYGIWAKMIRRCTDPSSANYHHYGGRGIRVCRRWLKLENFLVDMGPRPKGTSLGRKNNDGHYTPSNCRWETLTQQSNNKRTTRLITFKGRTQSVTQWARELGINKGTLFSRLKVKPPHEALQQ